MKPPCTSPPGRAPPKADLLPYSTILSSASHSSQSDMLMSLRNDEGLGWVLKVRASGPTNHQNIICLFACGAPHQNNDDIVKKETCLMV